MAANRNHPSRRFSRNKKGLGMPEYLQQVGLQGTFDGKIVVHQILLVPLDLVTRLHYVRN